MGNAPGSLESLRRTNRLRVLQTVQSRGAASRADIVRLTGLSRTTVSSLVAELVSESLLVERPDQQPPPASPNGGRPATLLTLDPGAGGFLGMHFGHDGLRVAVADLSCTVLDEEQRTMDVEEHVGDAFGHACEMAARLLGRLDLAVSRVVGLGVAVSAPVRHDSGAIASPSPLKGWDDVNVAEELDRRLGLPVYVGNDANLGAVAEWMFGAGRGVDDFVYVMLSDGIGSGIMLNGRLHLGATGTAGELGHVVVSPYGFVCRCGNRGCLETVAGGRALTAALSQVTGPNTTLDDVLRLARAGDPGARRAVQDAGRAVGRALSGLCTMLNPRLIIVGGRTGAAGEPLLDGIRASLAREVSPPVNGSVGIVPGSLGERAEVLGAIALAHRMTPAAALTGRAGGSAAGTGTAGGRVI
ncbi:ROK family transcriptional regulator [Actinacidiphila guanduensis]|uniref:Sugar kinase of the NBD/HSP70 family, may contain an N-terminal HTH domain n=1 Tax=Actinacidiphila guanduensis TaxID=310781 RepID=A0A1H0KHK3_9ACTN|nr:ROK family transcriptional regulator [Actinacidiphila guanduensis]SDO55296.1 Sugar kinase of the NBD/HSP70 family, may contain an N-terminal HTH domain [Actinacidiphila guanduensis]